MKAARKSCGKGASYLGQACFAGETITPRGHPVLGSEGALAEGRVPSGRVCRTIFGMLLNA